MAFRRMLQKNKQTKTQSRKVKMQTNFSDTRTHVTRTITYGTRTLQHVWIVNNIEVTTVLCHRQYA